MNRDRIDSLRSKILNYLRSLGMDSSSIDFESNVQNIRRQMKDGLSGSPESLLMIPTYIPVDGTVKNGQKVLVIDAGGSNLRTAAVTFNDFGKALISDFEKHPMIGKEGYSVTADEFFDRLAGYIAPYCSQTDRIGFCFSFPSEIYPNRDGRIINFNKDVLITGAEGRMLGEGLNASLAKLGIEGKKITVLNDTVAAMLAGISENCKRQYSNYFGFIYGTGINLAYGEKSGNIGKLPSGVPGIPDVMAINTEIGEYNGFERGVVDRRLDSESLAPGSHVFEKMFSGAYMGRLITMTLKQAAGDGLFSDKAAEMILAMDELSLKEIDDFIIYPLSTSRLAGVCGSHDDSLAAYLIIDELYERAAKMTAACFTAVMESSGTGYDPLMPVCITVEGTAYAKSAIFPGKLDSCIARYMTPRGLHLSIVQVLNADLIGSAIAALK
ncbi:MAG: hexokinase [Oscillospiraceae bacterium]